MVKFTKIMFVDKKRNIISMQYEITVKYKYYKEMTSGHNTQCNYKMILSTDKYNNILHNII